MTNLLEGHCAVITGAGSGIGRAIAVGYAKHGAKVALLDIDQSAAEATAQLVAEAGGKASCFEVDVANRQQCAEVAKGVVAELTKVTILVNNAGINRRNPITADQADVFNDWDDIIDINVKGVFNVTHAFMDQLRANKGRVVNIASIQSFVHVRTPNSAAFVNPSTVCLDLQRLLLLNSGRMGFVLMPSGLA